MKILIAHNHYQQYGGEDAVVQLECAQHRNHGQEVLLYERSNKEINEMSLLGKVHAALSMHWSSRSYENMRHVIRSFNPDIVHVYNTHFMMTASIYEACKEFEVPVVQSLYNFRLLCANALLLRNGRNCEECLHHSSWRSVWYKCYRHSAVLTACVVKAQQAQKQKKIWTHMVNAYIVANEYSRDKFVQLGIPRERFFIKPHFVYPEPLPRKRMDNFALYVGRLSTEKGVNLLINAWEALTNIPLKVLGAGPLLEELRQRVTARKLNHVEILGYRPNDKFFSLLSRAKFLVVPSINHDNSPRTVLEAYAFGVPVLASSVEGLGEMIRDGITGRTFTTGSTEDLVRKANWLAEDVDRLAEMGKRSRLEYEEKYTAERNYKMLLDIYEQTIRASKKEGVVKV